MVFLDLCDGSIRYWIGFECYGYRKLNRKSEGRVEGYYDRIGALFVHHGWLFEVYK